MTELLKMAIASGQVSAKQIESHRVAGDLLFKNDMRAAAMERAGELPIVMFEPQAVTDDAIDAARYRFIRSELSIEQGLARTKRGIRKNLMAWWPGVGPVASGSDEAVDAAIDAAIKATS